MNAVAGPRLSNARETDAASLARRLILLGNQMLKLAGEVSSRDGAMAHDMAMPGNAPSDDGLLGLLAEDVYRDRRRRAHHFAPRLFGEPAWDILLDLFAATGRGQAVSVSNACLAADVPASTALRWLQHLEDEGLVERSADPTDARRHFARLSQAGIERMNAYFGECRAGLAGELAIEPVPRAEEGRLAG